MIETLCMGISIKFNFILIYLDHKFNELNQLNFKRKIPSTRPWSNFYKTLVYIDLCVPQFGLSSTQLPTLFHPNLFSSDSS